MENHVPSYPYFSDAVLLRHLNRYFDERPDKVRDAAFKSVDYDRRAGLRHNDTIDLSGYRCLADDLEESAPPAAKALREALATFCPIPDRFEVTEADPNFMLGMGAQEEYAGTVLLRGPDNTPRAALYLQFFQEDEPLGFVPLVVQPENRLPALVLFSSDKLAIDSQGYPEDIEESQYRLALRHFMRDHRAEIEASARAKTVELGFEDLDGWKDYDVHSPYRFVLLEESKQLEVSDPYFDDAFRSTYENALDLRADTLEEARAVEGMIRRDPSLLDGFPGSDSRQLWLVDRFQNPLLRVVGTTTREEVEREKTMARERAPIVAALQKAYRDAGRTEGMAQRFSEKLAWSLREVQQSGVHLAVAVYDRNAPSRVQVSIEPSRRNQERTR